jgi:hypothetical protein
MEKTVTTTISRKGKQKPRNGIKNIRKKRRVIIKNNNVGTSSIGKSGIRSEYSGIAQRITDFRKYTGSELVREMRLYNKFVKDRYLIGLVHPDLAVTQQIPVKLYSDVPIPTASIGHHEQYEFTTNSSGNFLLSWRPSFLMTATDLINAGTGATDYSHITFNNNVTLNGTASTAGNTFVAGSYAPAILIQRYRLVSAIIKVSYNGSVLNQAGTIISCATFDPLQAATGNAGGLVSSISDSLVDRFGNFSIITNGLWNTSIDITNNSNGVECLYVPTDPSDYTFVRQGRFYTTAAIQSGLIAAPSDGAHINYIVAGRNFPASASCIMVNVYYNYEVVADPTSAPFLRSAPDTVFDSKDRDELHDTITGVVKQGSMIKPISKPPSLMEVLKEVGRVGMAYVPQLLGALI